MKTNKKTIISGFLSLVLVGGLWVSLEASNQTPGTNGDPLVSKSYVDAKINQVLSTIGSGTSQSNSNTSPINIEELKKDIAAQVELNLRQNMAEQGTAGPQLPTEENRSYVPVSAIAGQIILGGEGTEIILRSGKAVGYVPGENGLANITTGDEIFNSQVLSRNHMLIVPRNDGRGVLVTADAWFLIRGDFRIMEK